MQTGSTEPNCRPAPLPPPPHAPIKGPVAAALGVENNLFSSFVHMASEAGAYESLHAVEPSIASLSNFGTVMALDEFRAWGSCDILS